VADEAALPAVVLGHGWGGSKLAAERYAALFAAAGMITLTFTQASWGDSGSPRSWSVTSPRATAATMR
jgi:fermentation-respiration switch protein FrsA (DUF1100 family)